MSDPIINRCLSLQSCIMTRVIVKMFLVSGMDVLRCLLDEENEEAISK